MKDKIINLQSDNDKKNFEKKLWLYRSIFFKRTNFIIDNNENESYKNIINALNIKNRMKRITFIYDTICDQIDKYNIENHISCDFKNGKCGTHQKTNYYNGCCRMCRYQSENGCKTRNTACKLFFCDYVCKKSKPLTFHDIKLFKCLSIRCQIISNTNFFLNRKISLISLYFGSLILLAIFQTITILSMPYIFMKNKRT